MNYNLRNLSYRVALAVGALTSAASAMADGPDVSAVLTIIAGVVTAAASIGVAVLGLKFGVKAYKWISGAA